MNATVMVPRATRRAKMIPKTVPAGKFTEDVLGIPANGLVMDGMYVGSVEGIAEGNGDGRAEGNGDGSVKGRAEGRREGARESLFAG